MYSKSEEIVADGGRVASERLEFKRGGGALIALGLPFLLFGLATVSATASGRFTTAGSSIGDRMLGLVVGLVFVFVGGALSFGRAGTIVDRGRGQLIRWWGLMVPMRTRVYSLEPFYGVEISRRIVRTKNSNYTVYPVALAAPDECVELIRPRRHSEARGRAEEVAKFLELGIRDTSSVRPSEREAGTLDECLRERLEESGIALDWPEMPANCRIAYRTQDQEAVMELPATGFGLVQWIMIVGGVMVAVVSGVSFIRPMMRDVVSPEIRLVAGGFLVFLLVVLPIALTAGLAYVTSRARERITASWRGLQVVRAMPLSRTTWNIPAEALEELTIGLAERSGQSFHRLGVSQEIVAVSDSDTVRFGWSLTDAERNWLLGAILYIVFHAPSESAQTRTSPEVARDREPVLAF